MPSDLRQGRLCEQADNWLHQAECASVHAIAVAVVPSVVGRAHRGWAFCAAPITD